MATWRTTRRCPATPDQVWAVWSDVSRWPEWTTSVTGVEPLDGPAVPELGARVRLHQPRLATAVWTVTGSEPGRRFTWQSTAPGVRTVATHAVDPDDEGGSRITATIEQTGPLAGAVRLLLGGLVSRYLETEADGVVRRASSGPTGSGGGVPPNSGQ